MIYHVAPSYAPSDDLLSLDVLVERRGCAPGTAERYARRKWPEYPGYVGGESSVVHCHATLDAAREYRDDNGGVIIAIDTEYLDNVRIGHEYPHPVVLGSIPACCIVGVIA